MLRDNSKIGSAAEGNQLLALGMQIAFAKKLRNTKVNDLNVN